MERKEEVKHNPIDDLANAMQEKKVRLVFGLVQQGHIPTIENYIKDCGYFPKDEYNWERIAEKIGWVKFSACSYYADHLYEHNTALQSQVEQLTGRIKELEEALRVVPPERLRKLAEWFDLDDERKCLAYGGTTDRGHEVQNDLRKMADLSEKALQPKEVKL